MNRQYVHEFFSLSARLLDILACRKDPAGLTEGRVLMDGKAVTSDLRLSSAYVVQVNSSNAGTRLFIYLFFQTNCTKGSSWAVPNSMTHVLPGWRPDGNSVREREPSVQCQPAAGPKRALDWRKNHQSHFNHTRPGTGRLRRHQGAALPNWVAVLSALTEDRSRGRFFNFRQMKVQEEWNNL